MSDIRVRINNYLWGG